MKSNQIISFLLNVLIIFLVSSCKSSKDKLTREQLRVVNSSYNKKYKESKTDIIQGKLDNEKYILLLNSIENEGAVSLDYKLPVIIHFKQFGKNCIAASGRISKQEFYENNFIENYKNLASSYDAQNLFIYTEDWLFSEIFKKIKKYKLDTGFFKNQIFKSRANCSAFFVILPSGEFYQYYGEDYFSKIEEILAINNTR